MSATIIIATRNSAKAERLKRLCEGLNLTLIDGVSLGTEPDIEEGLSHMANAVRKAMAWASTHQEVALASDGGLAMPALGDGWMSLLTRRATGGDVSDEEHASRLLRRMKELTGERRAAHWTEGIAIARPNALLGAWEAKGLHGHIAEQFKPPPAGPAGFWVSGLWQLRGGDRRYWELTPQELAAESDPWEQLAGPVREMIARLG